MKVDHGMNHDFALSKTHVIYYALSETYILFMSCQKCFPYLLYLSFVWENLDSAAFSGPVF